MITPIEILQSGEAYKLELTAEVRSAPNREELQMAQKLCNKLFEAKNTKDEDRFDFDSFRSEFRENGNSKKWKNLFADANSQALAEKMLNEIHELRSACYQRVHHKKALAYVDKIRPVLYRDFRPELAPNAEIVEELKMNYEKMIDDFVVPLEDNRPKSSKGGLILYGRTGAGKTFAAWQLIYYGVVEQEFLDSDDMVALNVQTLKTLATNAARGDKDAQEAIDELKFASLLFLDDIHQAKLSSAFAGVLFDIIENAIARGQHLILTAQVTGRALVSKWCSDDPSSRDTANAIVRRLRDYCYAVELPKTKYNERE